MPDLVINTHGARTLLVLDVLSPGRGYGEAAEGILKSLSTKFKAYGAFAAAYALAADILKGGYIEVRLSPAASKEVRDEITRAAVSRFNPRLIVRPETTDDFVEAAGREDAPPAVACSPGRCLLVDSAESLEEGLASLAASRDEVIKGMSDRGD